MNTIDYEIVNRKIEELANTNKYSSEQLNAIKLALYTIGKLADKLMNPEIPADYMKMYIELSKRGIDIENYITDEWLKSGYSSDKLYNVIIYHSNGCDTDKVNPEMTKEKIYEVLANQFDEVFVNEMIEKSNLSDEEKEIVRGLNPSISKFLLKKAKENDISEFLSFPLNDFSLEQVKYLFAVYSTGEDISGILNPALTVEEMKDKVLNSSTSTQFLEEVVERHSNKKG